MYTIKNTMSILNEVNDFNLNTFIHSSNVANIAKNIAICLELSEADINRIYELGLFHDIGKSKIPSNILNKNGKLTEEEMEVMKLHTIYSEEIYLNMLMDNEYIVENADIVRHHHENVDGSGYPDNLKCEEIPFFSRILKIADIFDAITQPRIYRPYSVQNPFDILERLEDKEIDGNIYNCCKEELCEINNRKRNLL